MIYKVAEIFKSIQGECTWQGAPFCFIRLAGCNVGVHTPSKNPEINALKVLHPEHTICTSGLGQEFLCDTNYRSTASLTEDEIMEQVGDTPIVCFTGGEPFLWNLQPIIDKCWAADKRVHAETSGTLPIKHDISWIACAPKAGFLEDNKKYVNEWKFIVDRSLGDPKDVVKNIKDFIKFSNSQIVYIMPVNDVETINKENAEYAYEIVKASGKLWRVGFQAHKVVGWR